jgi:choline kinase
MIHSVVILAAGGHHRMGGDKPKALLSLCSDGPDGTCFLSRNLELYRALGVRRIYLVVSVAGRPYFEHFSGGDVDFVVVDQGGETTGSSVSMAAAFTKLLRDHPQGVRTLVTDADVVYERALLEAVGRLPGSALIAIDRVTGDSEEVRVYGRSENDPVLIGKGLSGAVVAGLRILGESLGLILLEAPELQLADQVVRWIVGDPPRLRSHGYGGRRSEHEEVWQYLFTLRRLPAAVLDGSLLFSECDFPADLEYIRDDLYPAITERDGLVGSWA